MIIIGRLLLIFVLIPIISFFAGNNLSKNLLNPQGHDNFPSLMSKAGSSPLPTVSPNAAKIPVPTDDGTPWGIAKQISEHEWTTKVGDDDRMATPAEILDALNDYRKDHGSQLLTWDEKLANYAQARADYFASIQTLDSHKGFIDYLNNEDGFEKLEFTYLGENSSIGYKLIGIHLIQWIYAGDEPHDKNQLNNNWDHVGIGVNGTATDLIFGTGKF